MFRLTHFIFFNVISFAILVIIIYYCLVAIYLFKHFSTFLMFNVHSIPLHGRSRKSSYHFRAIEQYTVFGVYVSFIQCKATSNKQKFIKKLNFRSSNVASFITWEIVEWLVRVCISLDEIPYSLEQEKQTIRCATTHFFQQRTKTYVYGRIVYEFVCALMQIKSKIVKSEHIWSDE